MDSKSFFDNFETIANAPGGIARLRELLLDLAVRGKLAPQTVSDQPSSLDSCEGPFEIPPSWRWVPLYSVAGDLGQEVPKGKFHYIDVGSINSVIGSISDEIAMLDSSEAPSRARKKVGLGTVLYSTVRPYLRNIAIIDREFQPKAIASTAFAVLHPNECIESKFLFACVRSPYFTRFVESKQKGVAYPAINASDMKEALIPLPPLDEQKRIIARVDELMAFCDELESAQNQRDLIRTAARKSAIDAISTATTPEELDVAWKRISSNWTTIADTPESISSLRSLILDLATRVGFDSRLEKYSRRKLGEISKVSWGNLSLTKSSYIENGSFLAVSAAGPDGRVGHAEHEAFTPVLSAIGARCGTVFLPESEFTAIKNTMTLTPDPIQVDSWFLYYSLMGSRLPRRGSAQPFLSKQDVEIFEITVPSLGIQHEIVSKVKELFELCDELDACSSQKEQLSKKICASLVSEIEAN